jgi:hypothetical protein
MIRSVACFFTIMMLIPGATAQPDQEGQQEFRLLYCRSSETASAWETSALIAIARIAGLSDKRYAIRAQRRKCGSEMPDATCFAGPGGLACRAPAIERVLQASAYLLAMWLKDGAPDYETFQQGHDRAVIDAFREADKTQPDPALTQIVERIRRVDATSESAGEDGALAAMFRFVTTRALAVIVGHELSHVNEEHCPIERVSIAEEDGTWNEAIGSHSRAELFCARPLVPNELVADRCALRFLHKLAAFDDALADSTRSPALARLAAEMAGYSAYFGFRSAGQWPPAPAYISGYLHGPLRVLLFTSELNANRSPAICGTAARLFVFSTQAVFKACSGNGIVSDPLLAKLPRGVEASWNGAPWTPTSWTCNKRGN